MKFASLCLLGYHRKEMLEVCLESLHDTIDYPCEVIVNMDAANTDYAAQMVVEEHFHQGNISKLLLSGGENRGVGRSFQNCLGVAEGEYIFKIDTDLTFKPHWLSTAINILEKNRDVGAVSLFDYLHYNPEEKRFKHIVEREDCILVEDFVSSIYGFRKVDLPEKYVTEPIPDDGLHQMFYPYRPYLVITKEDFVSNSGFGLGKSTYVVPNEAGEPVKALTHSSPLLFHAD